MAEEEEILLFDNTKPKLYINIKLGVAKTLLKVAIGELFGGIFADIFDRYMKSSMAKKVVEQYKELFEGAETGSPTDFKTTKKCDAILIGRENIYVVYTTGTIKKKRKVLILPTSSIKQYKLKGLVGKRVYIFLEVPYEHKGKKGVTKLELYIQSKKRDEYIRTLAQIMREAAQKQGAEAKAA